MHHLTPNLQNLIKASVTTHAFTTTNVRYQQLSECLMVCLHTCWQLQWAKWRAKAHLSLHAPKPMKTLGPRSDSSVIFNQNKMYPNSVGCGSNSNMYNGFSTASPQTESLRCFQFSCSSFEGQVRVNVCHRSFGSITQLGRQWRSGHARFEASR